MCDFFVPPGAPKAACFFGHEQSGFCFSGRRQQASKGNCQYFQHLGAGPLLTSFNSSS